MRKHICYYMRENIMILAAQSARATMLVRTKLEEGEVKKAGPQRWAGMP